ncbi:SGNH/GDSL hydrolase family protein [Mesorhizobium sp. J428]|uniref:SGNH/GDSL hydrolase family protein n=1 Tax=Mesorhizobium sp. J428 TaxID=2898440 RepID=UPI0021510FE0|nr:SGNH/GDSL hydrolase family protein [Mesorhizobium sp. J428]MCR5859790.1 SGNH/GDSL hydrolase family protein [Mesorhizobium sp. J428]
MKTVLCYGDSLTWGYDPDGPGRHAFENRWPSVLQAGLGAQVTVIAEGLNGRTTAFDDHLGAADRNGARLLPTILTTHSPVDLVILFLGANDMKPWIAGRAIAAKQGMQRLIDIIRGHAYPMGEDAPDILLVSPPPLCETGDPEFAAMFGPGLEQSTMLASLYSDLADLTGCGFFDAASVAKASPLDGVHLDAANTRAIGRGLEPIVRVMLGL